MRAGSRTVDARICDDARWCAVAGIAVRRDYCRPAGDSLRL